MTENATHLTRVGVVLSLGVVLMILGMGGRPIEETLFPPDFLWGAATSAYQVEGGNLNNDWYEWEQSGHGAEHAGEADDFYHRYDQDFALAERLGHQAHRLSIEWSRVEPKQGQFDMSEIEHYRSVLISAKSHHLKIFLTLHHFTNPTWVAAQNGWANPDVVDWFTHYVEVVARELGDLVDYWITVNEPTVTVLTSYVAGVTPPGKTDLGVFATVLAHYMKAHSSAYELLHSYDPHARVGFAHHMRSFTPARPWSPIDWALTLIIDRLWNIQLLLGFKTGVLKFYVPFLIDFEEPVPEMLGAIDFIGVNYYTRNQIGFDPNAKWYISLTPGDNPSEWENYPHGMYEALKKAGSFGYPIYITENGTVDKDRIKDSHRKRYLCEHLAEVSHALQDGVDVRGYLHWSLIDNFEWIYGFKPRFGLVSVDYSTLKRTPRASAWVYRKIIQSRGLDVCQN